MRIEQLRYFVETAQQHSIHKASEKLHISHQSLNASLSALEAELESVLLTRSVAGVTLTPAGEILLSYADTVLGQTAKLRQDLQLLAAAGDKPLSGSLHCLLSPHLAVQILPQLIGQFSRAYPAVTLHLKERDSKQIAQRFDDGYEGMALFSHYETASDTLPTASDLLITPLFAEVDRAVVSKQHPLAQYRSVSLKTLLQYPLALYQKDDEDSGIILDVLQKHGTPDIYMVSDNVAILENIAICGQAVTFAPQRALRRQMVFADTSRVNVLKIRDYPQIIISSIIRRSYYDSNRVLVDLLIDTFQNIW